MACRGGGPVLFQEVLKLLRQQPFESHVVTLLFFLVHFGGISRHHQHGMFFPGEGVLCKRKKNPLKK